MEEKRINKGERPTNAERLAKRASAAEVLDGVDQQRMWLRFLESKDERVAFDAWKYLNDRVYGKPSQSMKLGGEDNHSIQFTLTRIGQKGLDMRTMWTPKKEEDFLEALSDCCNVREACKVAGLARTTAYERRAEDSRFGKLWDAALLVGAEALEDEAVRRAREGVEEPVFYQRAQCGTMRKYSDTLLIFLLKGAKPEKYRERTESKMEVTADPEMKRVVCVNI